MAEFPSGVPMHDRVGVPAEGRDLAIVGRGFFGDRRGGCPVPCR